jgi:hypothetical protein
MSVDVWLSINILLIMDHHKAKLNSLCRFCGLLLPPKKKICLSVAKTLNPVLHRAFFYSENESMHPKSMCESCKRYLQKENKRFSSYHRKTPKLDFISYIKAIGHENLFIKPKDFVEHDDSYCNVCKEDGSEKDPPDNDTTTIVHDTNEDLQEMSIDSDMEEDNVFADTDSIERVREKQMAVVHCEEESGNDDSTLVHMDAESTHLEGNDESEGRENIENDDWNSNDESDREEHHPLEDFDIILTQKRINCQSAPQALLSMNQKVTEVNRPNMNLI